MSDIKTKLSNYVNLCRMCLTYVALCVILCQTLLSTVVVASVTNTSQEGEISIQEGDISLQTTEAESSDIVPLEKQSSLGGPHSVTDSAGELYNDSNVTVSDTIDEEHHQLSVVGSGDVVSSDLPNASTGYGGVVDELWLTGELVSSDGYDEVLAYEAIGVGDDGGSPTIELSMASEEDIVGPQLSITEVRIDGMDEYIEITNWGTSFVGSISIFGIKTSGLFTASISLGTNQSVVIGDTMSMVVQSGFAMINNQGLSMTDTAARSIQLIYSGEVIDTLDLTTTQVGGSDNLKASWEYNAEQQLWQVTPATHNINIITGEFGNPGAVWGLTLFATTTGSTSTGDTNTGSTQTGTVFTGDTNTGVVSVTINQIYPFSDCLGEHLSLYFASPYSGELTMGGLGTASTSKSFAVVAESGSTRHIVESMSGILSDNVILVPNITLTDGGETMTVVDKSGVVLDTVIYSSTVAGRASSYSAHSGDTRLFTINQSPTLLSTCQQPEQVPKIGGCRVSVGSYANQQSGLFMYDTITVSGSQIHQGCSDGSRLVNDQLITQDICQLAHTFNPGSHRVVYQQHSGSDLICEDEYMIATAIQIHTTTNTVTQTIIQTGDSYYCGIVSQNKAPFVLGNSINLIASLNDKELQNSSPYTCQRSGINFTGSDSCNPGYFTLPQITLVPLTLTISKDGKQLCQTQSFINYPSGGGGSVASASSYYEDLYRKRKEKHETLATNVRKFGCTVNAQDQLGKKCTVDTSVNEIQQSSSTETIQNTNTIIRLQSSQFIEITSIVADPPGRDSDGGELIHLKQQDDISDKHMILVINNKADRIVSGSGRTGMDYYIYDSFPLANAGGCIALTDLETIYDHVCYGDHKDANILNLETLSITAKMRTQFMLLVGGVPQLEPDSDIDLLNLDLKEQKLINKALKLQNRQKVSEVWDYYYDKKDELYHTYRSITDQKQSYIEYLQGRLQKTQGYADDITALYRQSRTYKDQYRSLKHTYDPIVYHIRQSYPALSHDDALIAIFGSGDIVMSTDEGIATNTISSPSRRATLKQTIRQLLDF